MTLRPTIRTLEQTTLSRITGPWCLDRVHVSNGGGIYTSTMRQRDDMTRAKGIERDQCGTAATHVWDGQPVCRRHAGDRALAWVMNSGEPARRRDVIDVR